MNFLQDFWNRLTGGRRREEEEEKRQAQARASTPTPASLPTPGPSRTLRQLAFDPIVPASQTQPAPPEPLKRVMEPVVQPQAPAQPKPKPESALRQLVTDKDFRTKVQQSTWNHITKDPFARDVVMPAVAGAASATLGAPQAIIGLSSIFNPTIRRLEEQSRQQSPDGKTWYDRLNDKGVVDRQIIEDQVEKSNKARVPEAVPLFGDRPYASLAGEAVIDPTNVLPIGKGLRWTQRALAGGTAAGISGFLQPAANATERAVSTILSALGGSVLSAPRIGNDVVPGNATDESIRLGNVRKNLDLAQLDSEARALIESMMDEAPPSRVDLNTQPSQRRSTTQIDTPTPSVDPTPSRVDAPTTTPDPDDVSGMIRQATPEVDTPSPISTAELGAPIRRLEPAVADIPANELPQRRVPTPEEQASLDSTAPEPARTPTPEVVDPRVEGAIPNPANALPETPVIPPAAMASQGQPTPQPTAMSDLTPDEQAIQQYLGEIFGESNVNFRGDANIRDNARGIYQQTQDTPYVRSTLPNDQKLEVALHESFHQAINTKLNDAELGVIRAAIRDVMESDPSLRQRARAAGYNDISIFEEVAVKAFTDFVVNGQRLEPAGIINAIARSIDEGMNNLSTRNPSLFNDVLITTLKVVRDMFEAIGDHGRARQLNQLFEEIQGGSLADRTPYNRRVNDQFYPLAGDDGAGMPAREAFDTWNAQNKQRLQSAPAADQDIPALSRVSDSAKGPDPRDAKPAQRVREAPLTRKRLSQALGTRTRHTTDEIAHDKVIQAKVRRDYDKRDAESIADEWGKTIDEVSNETGQVESLPSRRVQSIEDAHAALEALYRLNEDGSDKSLLAMQTILDDFTTSTRFGGQLLSLASRIEDNLHPSLRAEMSLLDLNKRREINKMKPLTSSEAAAFKETIEGHFTTLNEAKAAKQAMTKALDSKNPPESISDWLVELFEHDMNARAAMGEIQRTVDQYGPDRNILEKFANYGKISMLTSVAGRVNDSVSTVANGIEKLIEYGLRQPIGAALNRSSIASRKTKAQTGTLFNPALKAGTVQGMKDAWGAFRGDLLADNIHSTRQLGRAGASNLIRSQRGGAWNRIKNTTTAAVQLPSNLTKGVREASAYQQALSDAKSQGLTGDEATIAALKMVAQPTEAITKAADKLHQEINVMDDNILNRMINGFFRGNIQGKWDKGIRANLQNAIQPFTSFGAAATYNTLTKWNPVAASTRAAVALAQGDAQKLSEAIASGTISGSLTGMGLYLAMEGWLVPEDAEGYRDGGPFLKMKYGDTERYISVGFLGMVVGAGLSSGLALERTLEEGADNPAEFMGTLMSEFGKNTVNLAGSMGMMGGGNTILSDMNIASGRDTTEFSQAIPLRQMVRTINQQIPSLTSDINSAINSFNLFGSNPTNEEAKTRVERLDGSVDYTTSEINKIKNRIPGLSQKLPRNEGVPAADLIDRMTRGFHLSDTQKQAQSEEQRVKAQSADLKSRNIPDPYTLSATDFNTQVQRYRESDNFTIVAEALEVKRDKMVRDGASNKDLQKIDREIGMARVAEQNAITYEFFSMYPGAVSGEDASNVISKSEFSWMLDPDNHEYYNPELAERLYQIDTLMAEAGVSNNTMDRSRNFYTIPKPKSSGRGSGSSGGSVSKTDAIRGIDLRTFRPQGPDVSDRPIPQVRRLPNRELPKMRRITVS